MKYVSARISDDSYCSSENMIHIQLTKHVKHPFLIAWSIKCWHREVIFEDD